MKIVEDKPIAVRKEKPTEDKLTKLEKKPGRITQDREVGGERCSSGR